MAVNVARIYEQTIRPGRAFCRVCLRSGGETTLVSPKNILQFTDALKLNIFEGKRAARSVCYVCEAFAGTALRVYQACVNAVSIKNVCQPLRDMKPNDPVPESLRKAILGCNANLKEYRKKSVMQQTEVLVVDSSGIEWQPGEGSVNEPTKIVAPPVPIPRQLPQQQVQKPLVTVVLDDDDDEPPPKKQTATATTTLLPPNHLTPPTKDTIPTLVPITTLLDPKLKNTPHLAALLPEKMQILCRHEKEIENFILHPVTVGEKGVLVAPSLGAKVINGKLVYDAKIYKPLPVVDCTQTSYVVQGSSLKPAPNNSEPEEILPDKRVKYQERIYGTDQYKKVISDGADSANKRKASTISKNSQYLVDLDTINNILDREDPLSRLSNDEAPIAVITNVVSKVEDPIAIITDVVSSCHEMRGEAETISKVTSRAPQPVANNHRIDWEDKIPMDVISFVDSTNSDSGLIVPDRTTQPQISEATTQTRGNLILKMGDLGAGPSSGGKESLEKPNLLLSPRRKINHSPITPGEKIIALNMYKSLYKSSETYPEKTLIVKQVAEFMGTCEKTIRRIISEKRKSAVSDMESGAGPSSCKKRPQLPEPPNFLLSPIKKVKRRSFTSREKILALNMYKYLYKSSETYPEPDKTLIVKQVAEIMGTSQSALRRIISERRKSAVPEIETGAGPSSGKKRPRSPEPPNFLLTPIKKVKRKTFTSREKIIAINMYKYFYKSSKTYPDKTVTVKQVAEVMGTSQSIIRRIISEKSS